MLCNSVNGHIFGPSVVVFFYRHLHMYKISSDLICYKWQIKYDTNYFQLIICTCTYCIKNNDIINHACTI